MYAAADVCNSVSDKTLAFTTMVNSERYLRDFSPKSFAEQPVMPGEPASEGHYSAVTHLENG